MFIPGDPILSYPDTVNETGATLLVTYLNQDAPGEIVTTYGFLTSQSWSTGSKNIIAIDPYFSNLSRNSSSFEISIQNISSSGPPIIPDGNILGRWTGSLNALGNARNSLLLNTPISVVPGERKIVQFRYLDFIPGASVIVGSFANKYANPYASSTNSTNTGSTWSAGGQPLILRFLCDDGSYIHFDYGAYNGMFEVQSFPDFTNTATGNGIDGGDERGMLWIPSKTYDITYARIFSRQTFVNATLDVSLYDGNTLIASQSYTNADIGSTPSVYSYFVVLPAPYRVVSGSNIRLTVKPTSNIGVRWIRYTFTETDEFHRFMGKYRGEPEFNLSVTNRIDNGAWNSPLSASRSFVPVQFHGYEVTGPSLLSGSRSISGSVTLNNLPVSGATVRAIRQSDNIAIVTSSNASGSYRFSNIATGSYHLVVEYETGGQKYNTLSKWDVPVT